MRFVTCFLVSILLITTLSGCFTTIENEIISEHISPDGKYTAVVFSRNGGATTSTSYLLSVLKKGEKVGNSIGNAFNTESKFSVQWLDNKKLLVSVDDFSREVIYKNEKIDDVIIEYEEKQEADSES